MSRSRHLAALALGAAIASALLLASAGLGLAVEPDADFSFQPITPEPNETVTFAATASNPDGGFIDSIEWDFGDGEVAVGDALSVQHAYGSPGDRTVRMLVTDSDGEQTLVEKPLRVNAPPDAAFDFAPAVPNAGEKVRFDASGSVDDAQVPPDGYDWDLNGDNDFPDAEGPVAELAFGSPGDKTVRLRVTDADGAASIETRTVHVNHPPVANFVPSPRSPLAAEAIDFTSISTDPEDPIAAEAWDLDGDGQFDDGRGKTVSRSFAEPGPHTVGLRVTDVHGATGSRSIPVEVRARPRPPEAEPEQLNPFIGIATLSAGRRGRRVTLLAVRVRGGAIVTARCRGRSCPKRRVRRRSRGRVLRLRPLERPLRVGTRISIAVTYPGRIGSYTVIVIRRRRYERRDLCLVPGRKRPGSCPSS
jgi:PKD repeat protein